jgi:hypothetical protein
VLLQYSKKSWKIKVAFSGTGNSIELNIFECIHPPRQARPTRIFSIIHKQASPALRAQRWTLTLQPGEHEDRVQIGVMLDIGKVYMRE